MSNSSATIRRQSRLWNANPRLLAKQRFGSVPRSRPVAPARPAGHTWHGKLAAPPVRPNRVAGRLENRANGSAPAEIGRPRRTCSAVERARSFTGIARPPARCRVFGVRVRIWNRRALYGQVDLKHRIGCALRYDGFCARVAHRSCRRSRTFPDRTGSSFTASTATSPNTYTFNVRIKFVSTGSGHWRWAATTVFRCEN